MHYTTILASVLGLASISSAHMIMTSPVPFGVSTLTNSPLVRDGGAADFPCKQRTGVYDAEGASNTMAIGSVQKLAFKGTAVHGGGSCQISITYDEAPTESSTFKVIHSILGGCPAKNVAGNLDGDNPNTPDPDTYSFTVPDSLPTGTAVLAWTWFNKVGNREMYMNCAPITITAASSKRSDQDDFMTQNATQIMQRDTAAYDALPNMFVANTAVDLNCKTQDGGDLAFPDPGDSVETLGGSTYAALTPVGCTATAAAAGSATTGVAGAAGSSQAPVASVATSVPAAASSAAANSPGVFATVASAANSPTSMASAPVVASSAASSVVASSAAPSVIASAPASSQSPASTGAVGTGSALTAGSACTSEGMWNCIGGTSFQQCASGEWSAVQQVAAGTICTSGQSMSMAIVAGKPKRAVRFSSEHVRRHAHGWF